MDRFLVNNNLMSNFTYVQVSHLNFHSSDHILVNLSSAGMSKKLYKSRRMIRFKESWIKF